MINYAPLITRKCAVMNWVNFTLDDYEFMKIYDVQRRW